MGFISSFTKCFCCDLEDEDQPSEQEPKLFATPHYAPRNGGPLSQRLLISSPCSDSCSDRSPDGVSIPNTCLDLYWNSISADASHDQNDLEFQECQDFLSNLSTASTDILHDQNDLEFQECLDYHSDSSSSDLLQQQAIISSVSFLSRKDSTFHGTFRQDLEVAGLHCFLDSATLVNNREFVEGKKQDRRPLDKQHFEVPVEKKQGACLLEELHLEELISEKQDVCLPEELHFKESIANKKDVRLPEELHFEALIPKKQDACLAGELHFEEPIEKRQGVCLQEDLRSEEPVEDVEEREEEVIKGVVIKGVVAEERWISHYSSFQKMLLVGEGDFSFSASLARAFGSASNMIATSLDSKEFLRKNYWWAPSNIEDLQNRGCRVMHGVDATEMANNPLLKGVKFDRIIYNFPHAGFFKTESREWQISQHQRLVSLFLKNAKENISEEGEIHITHKTNGFHYEWNIELLASRWGLRLIEALHFNHTDYPRYSTKYGFGGNKFFNCNPSNTYEFGLQNASTKKRRRKKRSLGCKMI